jgi:hypothetical protein
MFPTIGLIGDIDVVLTSEYLAIFGWSERENSKGLLKYLANAPIRKALKSAIYEAPKWKL